VIVNLAMFFSYHALWPRGFSGMLDPVAAVLLVVSALALFRWKQSVPDHRRIRRGGSSPEIPSALKSRNIFHSPG
jgi:hypothetical protein